MTPGLQRDEVRPASGEVSEPSEIHLDLGKIWEVSRIADFQNLCTFHTVPAEFSSFQERRKDGSRLTGPSVEEEERPFTGYLGV